MEKRPTITLICAWLVIFFAYFLTIQIPPMLGDIMSDLHISFSEAGLIVTTPVAMVVILSSYGGWLGDKYGYKRIVAISAGIMVVGSLMRGYSYSFPQFILFSALLGTGIALMYPNLPKMVRTLFPPSILGTATGIYSTGIASGSSAALGLTNSVILPYTGGWRTALVITSCIGIIPLILWAVLTIDIRPGTSEAPPPNLLKSWKFGLSSRGIVFTALMILFLNAVFYGLIGWLPTYLTSVKLLDLNTMSLLATSMTLLEIPGLFILPLASDRVELRRPFLAVFFFVLGICSIGIITLPNQLLWIILPLAGFSMGGLFSILLTLPAEMLDGKIVGIAAGVALSIGYIGSLLGAPLAGLLRDLTGSFDSGFVAFLIFSMAAVLISLALSETGHRRKAV